MPTDAKMMRRYVKWPLLLYGVLLIAAGIMTLVAGSVILLSLLVVATIGPGFAAVTSFLTLIEQYLILLGALLVCIGAVVAAIDLLVLLPHKRQRRLSTFQHLENRQISVVLTAYNDELSIGEAVLDFLSHPSVKRVIVVDNNSRDRTSEIARRAGAQVVLETQPGYGRCVFRALTEGASQPDTDLTLLCEGDMTFRAFDIDKFLAYAPHAEIVNGTRIVEQLREQKTQLTTFMYYGNFFVGKLLEAKHVGKGTFTDVGTTYKLCRNEALKRLLLVVDPSVNLEFNAHFLDTALTHRFTLVECPITFHQRVGVSKGGNIDDFRALSVGLRMLKGILYSWK